MRRFVTVGGIVGGIGDIVTIVTVALSPLSPLVVLSPKSHHPTHSGEPPEEKGAIIATSSVPQYSGHSELAGY